MGIIGKVCCDCIHYRHGDTEDPCIKGNKKCGYLHPGCWRWESEDGKEVIIPTKVCSICGQELPVSNFYVRKRSKDGYSPACMSCFSNKDKEEQRIQRRKRKEELLADVAEGYKLCSHCERALPRTEFNKCKDNKDGLETYCKECRYKKNQASKAKKKQDANRTDRC